MFKLLCKLMSNKKFWISLWFSLYFLVFKLLDLIVLLLALFFINLWISLRDKTLIIDEDMMVLFSLLGREEIAFDVICSWFQIGFWFDYGCLFISWTGFSWFCLLYIICSIWFFSVWFPAILFLSVLVFQVLWSSRLVWHCWCILMVSEDYFSLGAMVAGLHSLKLA